MRTKGGRGSSRRTQRLLLWCAATDRTFERAVAADGRPVLTGKCIHCNTRHTITEDGAPLTSASIEHIVPRAHGGTDAIANLAIACNRCNYGKGHRLDDRPWHDPTLQRVIATLQERRAARMRPPPEWLDLPPLSQAADGEADDDA
ncbi:HNH endonuclease [Nannocystis sp. SCPEA4]|uniref:HNH endonuclease n=1 Tax=Nannocystis sp. SCPEA4 TaxID=2996787 RepID=UPI0022721FB8|nr:HNH endonuclease [Nannocystis sp. SCPEA4]MCY1056163.1 HNH endonuclease [Nannocystis sp. SCPEA4]